MASIVFFSINSLMGVQYEGDGQSNRYIYFCVMVFLLVSISFFYDIRKNSYRVALLIPVVLSIMFLFEYSLAENSDQSDLMRQSFSAFWAFSVSCIFVGVALGNTKDYIRVFKYIDLLSLIVAMGCLKALPSMLLSNTDFFGGGNYQQFSYSAAFVFSVFLFNLLYNNQCRFSFLDNKLYSFVTIILMLGCVVCVFGSGGRGGFLLMVINMIILCFTRGIWILRHILWIIVLIPVILLVLSIFDIDQINEITDSGIGRITDSLFSSDSSSVSRAGRDDVFETAYKLIYDNPYGYGFFRSYAVAGNYPHNLFLEILLDGGYLLFTLFLYVLFLLGNKLRSMLKENSDLGFLLLLTSYPLIMLMATTSYLWTGLFWFVISIILTWRSDNCPSVNV